MNQPELGKKVLELRQKKGWTQGELAENCKISLRTVQRIESSEVTPRRYTIKVLLSALDYDLNNSSTDLSDHSKKELFNLKYYIMKKISVISVIVLIIVAGVFIARNGLNAFNTKRIDGWFLAGSQPNSYVIGLDKSEFKTGNSSAFLESQKTKINGFGTLMQTCSAEEYLGKRVKMTAYIKSANVTDWAGMWLRVDSEHPRKTLSFDNMQNRPIKGDNDWMLCEIILDVPEESATLNFGVLLSGTGKVWFDSVAFDVVDKSTNDNNLNKKPVNLDFGE